MTNNYNPAEIFGEFSLEGMLCRLINAIEGTNTELSLLRDVLNGNKFEEITIEDPEILAAVEAIGKEEPTHTDEPEAAKFPPEDENPRQEEKHTLDDIRALVRGLTAAGKSAVGKKIIKDHGYTKVSEIKDKDLETIYTELTEAKEAK